MKQKWEQVPGGIKSQLLSSALLPYPQHLFGIEESVLQREHGIERSGIPFPRPKAAAACMLD